MGFWRVLGGIATGIAVVVALPVAGPVGAITATGALVAGGIGGAAGAASGRGGKKSKDYQDGEEHERARTAAKVEKLERGLQEAQKRLHTDQEHFDFLIALLAVGLAVANIDGHIAPEEERDINEFVAGVAGLSLPAHVNAAIARLKANPPSFATAMQYVEKVPRGNRAVFEDVIEVAIAADGVEHEKETAIRQAWRDHRAAA